MPKQITNCDIAKILADWPFEPGQVNARIVQGENEDSKIQIRLDLGLLQMNWSGRPDGVRPDGHESLLEYHEARLDHLERGGPGPETPEPEAEPTESPGATSEGPEPAGPRPAEGGPPEESENGEPEAFSLSAEECRQLRDEAVQYYHRYVAMLVLEEHDGVVRDTTRNLRVLDLCAAYATEDTDRTVLEQFRPYITMMRARALASMALKEDLPKVAVFALDEALEVIRAHFAERGSPQTFDEAPEVEALRGMRDALVPRLPVSQKAELRQRLQRALEQENYELAAILRDELRQIKDEK